VNLSTCTSKIIKKTCTFPYIFLQKFIRLCYNSKILCTFAKYFINCKDMAAVKSGEFVSNQNKYFDTTIHEDVCIKNGKNMFAFGVVNEYKEPDMIFEPDDDFYRSISGEELKKRLHVLIDKLYAN
jgi:hypothetical protein